MKSKIVVMCALALGLVGCGGGSGESAPKDANIDYPLDYGATLFPDSTEAQTEFNIHVVTKDDQGYTQERIIYTKNTNPSPTEAEIKSEFNQSIVRAQDMGNTVESYADSRKALIDLEGGFIELCIGSKTQNTMSNLPIMSCHFSIDGTSADINLSRLDNRNVYMTNGKILEEAQYRVNIDLLSPEGRLNFPILIIGLHQGIGITSVSMRDGFTFGDDTDWISKIYANWQTTNTSLL